MKAAMSKLMVSVAAISLLAGPLPAYAQSAPSGHAQTEVEARSSEQLKESKKDVVAEATEALAATRKALEALESDQPDKALEHLTEATGKLEIVLARRPELALAPVDASVETIRVLADVDTLREARKAAMMALLEGDTQTARMLLSGFADHTAVSVENLPMATYPTAIKRAAALIEAGKIDEAKADLQQTLSTVVVTETVYPYPVISAALSLSVAEELAAKKRKNEKERAALALALEAARTSLQRAEIFGYISPATSRSFESQIRAIELATIAGGKAEREFAELLRQVREASSTQTRSR